MVAGNFNKPKDCLLMHVLNGCSFKAKEVSTGGEFAVHFEAGASYVMSLHDGMVRFFDKRAAKMLYSFPRTHLLIITRRGGAFRLERTGAGGSYVIVAPKADADHDFLVDEQETIIRVRSLFVLLEPMNLTEHMRCSLFSIVERAVQDPFTLVYVNEAFTAHDHQVLNMGALFECIDLARKQWPKAHRTQIIFVVLKTKHAFGWCDDPMQHAGTCNCGQHAALLEIAQAFDGIELKLRYDNHMHDRHIKLNNGWSVFLGRGLDIFQNIRGPFGAKAHRPCRETQITYWKNPDFSARDVAHGSDAPISLKASL